MCTPLPMSHWDVLVGLLQTAAFDLLAVALVLPAYALAVYMIRGHDR